MRDGRIRVWSARGRLGWIFAPLSVHMEQAFGLRVIRLEHIVFQRPGGRESILMTDLVKVALAHPKESGAVNLGVSANIVVQAGLETAAVLAVPGFSCLIGSVDKHGLRIPVGAGAGKIIAALDQQDAFAGGAEPLCQ